MGLTKKVKVWQKLSKEDKESLKPYNVSEIVDKYSHKNPKILEHHPRKIKIKKMKIDFCDEFINEANENTEIYPYIYVLENSLRKLILGRFKDEKEWWNNPKFVHKDIQDYAKKIQEVEKKYKWMDKRGSHPIYYINLEHLFKIIEKNWTHFKKTFDDLGHLRTWIAEITPIRNLVAHNIKTKTIERNDIKSRCEKICKLINNSKV